MTSASLVVPARFNGPPGSANGGYFAGLLAARVGGAYAVTVTLREPPPLNVALHVQLDDHHRLVATFGGAVIATAEPGELAHEQVDPVSLDLAAAAEARYAGSRSHPFPTCFACGPGREEPDGLGLRPGRVTDDDRVACTWAPDPSLADHDGLVAEPLVWSALDCPSGWASDLEARPMVLGRITAAVDERPRAGDRCVVVARVLAEEGRKTYTASTAYDPDGRVLGRAEATWIALR